MRTVGFELEFSDRRCGLPHNQLLNRLRQVIPQYDGHTISESENVQSWTLKTDHCGYEFTSPAMPVTEESFNKIYNVIEALRTIVNENRPSNLTEFQTVCEASCGFHVHIDISDFSALNIVNLINIFKTFEQALLTIQPPSRRNNSYVGHVSNDSSSNYNNINNVNDLVSFFEDHYDGINLSSYYDYNTVEIRYGASTMMGRKVVNWIQLLTCLVGIAKKMTERFEVQSDKTVIDLKRFIRQHQTGYTFLNSRRANLARWIDTRVQDLANYEAARIQRQEIRRSEREARRAERENNQEETTSE